MGDVIDIKGQPVNLADNQEFICDMSRFAEGLESEAAIRKKYRVFDDATWTKLGEDDELVRAITDEKTRRIRNGSHKREKAQLLVVKAPDVAASIMNSAEANDRHRLDACKVLNDFAANPQENTPAGASDKFIITINLGADTDGKPIVEHYSKSIAIDPNDGDPNGGFVTPREPVAAIADKQWDDSDVAAAPEQEKPVKAPAPMRTGYRQVDPGKISNKRPAAHKPVEPMTDSRSAYDIALASLMEKG